MSYMDFTGGLTMTMKAHSDELRRKCFSTFQDVQLAKIVDIAYPLSFTSMPIPPGIHTS